MAAATLTRKDQTTDIYGPSSLFDAVTAPAARASRCSATRGWAR